MRIASFLGEQSLTVVVGDRPRNIPRTHPNFDEIVALVQDDNADEAHLLTLLDPLNPVRDMVIDGTSIVVHETTVTRSGEELPMYLQQRIIDTVKAGLPVEPWKLFVERVYANPSFQSRSELALFMEKSGLPMTPEGKFYAYKRVNEDYTDTYTRSIDNSVGQEVTMPGGRQKVNDNRDMTCSQGLHFCSQGYLKNYYQGSGRIMILEIDPADVVSIPHDYQNTKGRCWRYKVVGEVSVEEEHDAREWGVVSYDFHIDPIEDETDVAKLEDFLWQLEDDLAWLRAEGLENEADKVEGEIEQIQDRIEELRTPAHPRVTNLPDSHHLTISEYQNIQVDAAPATKKRPGFIKRLFSR